MSFEWMTVLDTEGASCRRQNPITSCSAVIPVFVDAALDRRAPTAGPDRVAS